MARYVLRCRGPGAAGEVAHIERSLRVVDRAGDAPGRGRRAGVGQVMAFPAWVARRRRRSVLPPTPLCSATRPDRSQP
jgi:hypothetical protein